MRILVLTNMYPPHAYGGYEQSCRDVVERWRSAGHDVLVVTSQVRVPGVAEPPTEERSAVWRDLHLYWDDHEILNPSLLRRWAWERANAKSLDRALEDFRPDVASAWAMGAMSMGMLSTLGGRRIPVVSVICDEWPVYGPKVDAWLRPLASRAPLARLVKLVTRLPTLPPNLDILGPGCFISDFVRGVVRKRSQWSFRESGIVYSGIATDEFNPADVDSAREERPWSWRLLYVGRIDPRKGIDCVVRALVELPEAARLEINGRGDDRYLAQLHELVRDLRLSDRVTFALSPRAELVTRYKESDVVVFPPVWEEPFGLVPLEAMACGTPVVATPSGGAREFLVDERNCLLFPANEVGALVSVLDRLAADHQLRRTLVEGGRSTASEFSIDRLAEVLEAWHAYACGIAGASFPGDRSLPSVLTVES